MTQGNAARARLEAARFQVDLPRARAFDVVGMGLNAVDWVVQVPRFPERNSKTRIETFRKLAGGQVATAMALCGRYGLKTRYIGRVGDDEIGRFSLSSLQVEPMDISLVEVIPGAASQYAIILVDPEGQRTILWDRDPALTYRPDDLEPDWISAGRILHLDGHDEEASICCAEWATRAGMKTCLDIDKVQSRTGELLALIDFALPSEHFARQFTGALEWREALRGVAAAVRGFTAMTRDSEGCALLWKGEIHEVPSFEVEAVDSTGAGDVFHGAFIYALLKEFSVWDCLRFANAAGALSCTRAGARDGIPTLREVEDLLREG